MIPSGLFETIQFPFNFVTNEPADELLPLAEKHDIGFIAMKPFAGGMLANAKLALKYLLQFDNVVPDPGVETAEEIEEVVDIVNGPWELTAQERQAIEDFRAQAGTRFCRRCEYCQPCPQGVRISTIMNLPSFLKRFSEEKLSEGWIADAMQTGENCIECGECEERCPYGLPIRELIQENYAFYKREVGRQP
jgi:predicted aldo/keto reductase-like oxidoreductase